MALRRVPLCLWCSLEAADAWAGSFRGRELRCGVRSASWHLSEGKYICPDCLCRKAMSVWELAKKGSGRLPECRFYFVLPFIRGVVPLLSAAGLGAQAWVSELLSPVFQAEMHPTPVALALGNSTPHQNEPVSCVLEAGEQTAVPWSLHVTSLFQAGQGKLLFLTGTIHISFWRRTDSGQVAETGERTVSLIPAWGGNRTFEKIE